MKNTFHNTAVALGYFDGVHIGHSAVISATAKCKGHGLTPILYTFSDNPHCADNPLKNTLLSTREDKKSHIESLGIEKVIFDDFLKIKDMTAEAFVADILVKKLHAKKVFCGFNYHFGKGGRADATVLYEMGQRYGIQVYKIEPVKINGDIVSSTRIRNCIVSGEIEEANAMLGYNFGFSSVIMQGNHIGTKMDTPTINQELPKGLILPKFGVYTSVVTVDDTKWTGVTNIGVKPTIGDYSPLSETWLPKYKGEELYGKEVDIRLIKFQRPEQKFRNIKTLFEQIKKDGLTALSNSPLNFG